MQPMREQVPPSLVELDPALLVDPRAVIARTKRPPGRRVFPHAGPVDPAYLGRDRAEVSATYTPVSPPWNRVAIQIVVILAVGSGLGVLIAGLPK